MAEPHKQIEVSAFEPKDIGEGFIWGAVGISLAVLLGCALIVVWLYPYAASDRILSLPLPEYPEPRLQADPAADLRRFRARELEQLNGIDAAMQQVAAEGITGWPPP